MSKPMLMPWPLEVSETELQPAVLLACHMVDEVWEVADAEQAEAFFRSTGRRIGRAYPLGEVRSNDEILSSMNAFWAESGWGRTALRFADTGLEIVHSGLPSPPPGVELARWRETAICVLAGIYDHWLGQLGGSDSIRTRVTGSSARGVDFFYGA